MKKWIIFVFCLISFILIAILVSNDMTVSFDNMIYNLIANHQSDLKTKLFKNITFFASEYGILIVTIMCFILIKDKKCDLFILFSALITVLLNFSLKLIFMRTRPFDLMIIDEVGYSFPSGHTMLSLGFYGFIIYIIRKFNIKYKNVWTILLSILIFSIGISRIYLGVHYPSDVIAGYLISSDFLIIYTAVANKYV